MSRLIDVDKLIKRFEVLRDEHETHSISYNALYEILVKEPTAFDTEKVVEQLKEAETDISSLGHYAVYADDAIKIVLKGGTTD